MFQINIRFIKKKLFFKDLKLRLRLTKIILSIRILVFKIQKLFFFEFYSRIPTKYFFLFRIFSILKMYIKIIFYNIPKRSIIYFIILYRDDTIAKMYNNMYLKFNLTLLKYFKLFQSNIILIILILCTYL